MPESLAGCPVMGVGDDRAEFADMMRTTMVETATWTADVNGGDQTEIVPPVTQPAPQLAWSEGGDIPELDWLEGEDISTTEAGHHKAFAQAAPVLLGCAVVALIGVMVRSDAAEPLWHFFRDVVTWPVIDTLLIGSGIVIVTGKALQRR